MMADPAGRLLLLVPTNSYRVSDFLDAAERLGVVVAVGANRRQALEHLSDGQTVTIDFKNSQSGLRQILDYHQTRPLLGIVAVDEVSGVLAATAAKQLGLPHNEPDAIARTGNKFHLRECLAGAGLRQPRCELLSIADGAGPAANGRDYPCVLKPLNMAASRGVIRADDRASFESAFDRVANIVAAPDKNILVEDFWPGDEVAVEGMLNHGKFQCLAIFDKPDPLDGPYFEETIYVTPSRLSRESQAEIIGETARAVAALGLGEGPVHAELRINQDGPWMIEVAARSIGGLCSRVLEFGAGVRLEDIILRHALGQEIGGLSREARAAGVMMIPIPDGGRFEAVGGLDAARQISGIEEITITMARGSDIVPLPEGSQYLGFIFAKSDTPDGVETALRKAHDLLKFSIR